MVSLTASCGPNITNNLHIYIKTCTRFGQMITKYSRAILVGYWVDNLRACQKFFFDTNDRYDQSVSIFPSRGLDCPNGRADQRAGVLDYQVCAIIGDLKLPQSWRELVSGYLASGEERKKESNERRCLEEKLRCIRVQYREGDIDRRSTGKSPL